MSFKIEDGEVTIKNDEDSEILIYRHAGEKVIVIGVVAEDNYYLTVNNARLLAKHLTELADQLDVK
jgi:hypothetical protein